MTTTQAIQALALVLAVAILVATYHYIRRHPDLWAYTVPPVAWTLHVLVFYVAVFLRDIFGWFAGLDFVLWSAIIRLQAGILIFGVMAMLAYDHLIFKASASS